MYTCKKCEETFMSFDEYQEHRMEHFEAEQIERDKRMHQMFQGVMEEASKAVREQAAYYLASACIRSGYSADEAIRIFHEIKEKLVNG